ncbi:MAG: hypothetical protein ACR2IE_06730 [Candidatus Sumerlaeaceae bacterium]
MEKVAAVLLSLLGILLFYAPAARAAESREHTTTPVNILFDTDMGSDCDDAGALAALHKLADYGEVNLLGVIFSSGRNPYGVGVCDAINTYYGRGELPLGQYKKDDVGDPVDRYCRIVATNTKAYRHNVVDSAPDLLRVYKDVLQAQPDGSVTIVTVGHLHGLSHLIDDAEGLDLVRRKVKQCVSMGGAPDTPQEEWNLCRPGVEGYVANVLKKWPTPHYISAMGADILTGHRKLPSTPEENPVREAYLHYDSALKKGRSSWDQVAVLYAARPHLFKVERGTLKQDEKFRVVWSGTVSEPPRYRVIPLLPHGELEAVIEDLMSAPPRPKP